MIGLLKIAASSPPSIPGVKIKPPKPPKNNNPKSDIVKDISQNKPISPNVIPQGSLSSQNMTPPGSITPQGNPAPQNVPAPGGFGNQQAQYGQQP